MTEMQFKIPRSVVLNAVAEVFQHHPKRLISQSRAHCLVVARAAATHMMREVLAASYPDISRTLGNRDHTTMIWAKRRADEWLATDLKFVSRYADAKRKVLSWRPGDPLASKPDLEAVMAPPKVKSLPAVKIGASSPIPELRRATHGLDDPTDVKAMRDSVQRSTDKLGKMLEGMRPL